MMLSVKALLVWKNQRRWNLRQIPWEFIPRSAQTIRETEGCAPN
jgi:hypothetical protein